MKKYIFTSLLALAAFFGAVGPTKAQTKTTHCFAVRDTADLYLDLYMPEDPALVAMNRPVVLFAFGGGFQSGTRDHESYLPWFRALCSQGFPVVSIDYRLGLKGIEYKMNFKFLNQLQNAIDSAVEDMYSATVYLLKHAETLRLENRGIVISGSSAGAVMSLQAEYYIANGFPLTSLLPEGFNYAGVMAFSGAVLSHRGRVRYDTAPCPQLLFHGTDDRMVTYRQIRIFHHCFGGSNHIARQLKRAEANYQIWRFSGHYHEICVSMLRNLDKELPFLCRNVERGERVITDAVVDDPVIPIPDWGNEAAVR